MVAMTLDLFNVKLKLKARSCGVDQTQESLDVLVLIIL